MKLSDFLLKETLQRPNYLWLYWGLTVFGFIWLLFALVVDELVMVEIKQTTGSSKQNYWCGWEMITTKNNELYSYEYTSCDAKACSTNNSAGQTWLAFNLLAIILGYCVLGYGFLLDIKQGGFDVSPLRDKIAEMGYKYPFGYTVLGTVMILFWQILGIIIYYLTETCSTQEMWNSILSNISSFSTSNGASFALDILSLIFIDLGLLILLLVRVHFKNLPKSTSLSVISVPSATSTAVTIVDEKGSQKQKEKVPLSSSSKLSSVSNSALQPPEASKISVASSSSLNASASSIAKTKNEPSQSTLNPPKTTTTTATATTNANKKTETFKNPPPRPPLPPTNNNNSSKAPPRPPPVPRPKT